MRAGGVEHAGDRHAARVGDPVPREVEEQPLRRPHGPVEPDRVVEAGAHQRVPLAAERVGQHRDPEQVLVGEVGERAGVHHRVVAELLGDPHPRDLLRHRLAHRPHHPMVEEQVGGRLGEVVRRADRVRGPDRLAVLPFLLGLEAGDEVQDRPTRLVRDDGPGRERPTVAHALHLVEDGLRLGAGAHEVRVQRVHAVRRVDGETGRTEGLGHHLTAVEPRPADLRVPGEERVRLHAVELEQGRDAVDGMEQHAHGSSLMRGAERYGLICAAMRSAYRACPAGLRWMWSL